MARNSMDRLTGQLNFLPGIIGKMGLSIAEAQKEFNADYVTNVAKLLGLISRTLPAAQNAGGGAGDNNGDQRVSGVWELLKSLAPPRYQFTETTIEFRADLAETKDVNVQAGLGAGMYGVTVNAALTLGFGYDYRSAAQITSVIHAHPAGSDLAEKLLGRAKEINAAKLELPALSTVEKDQWNATANIVNALFNLEGEKQIPATDAGDKTDVEEK